MQQRHAQAPRVVGLLDIAPGGGTIRFLNRTPAEERLVDRSEARRVPAFGRHVAACAAIAGRARSADPRVRHVVRCAAHVNARR